MKKLAYLAGVVVLAGCASTAPQYYSLQAPAAMSPAEGSIQAAYAISVQPVIIPEPLARPQIVVSDSVGAEVVPLNAALWVGPLESQIRDLMADALSRRLNVLELGQAKGVEGIPVWNIFIDVHRFDSIYNEGVYQDVVWRMVPSGLTSAKERVCSAQLHRSVGDGMNALVEGHRAGLIQMAGLIADSLPGTGSQAKPTGVSDSSGTVVFRGCAG
jgi:uncharacterized lipoprotein YmbA